MSLFVDWHLSLFLYTTPVVDTWTQSLFREPDVSRSVGADHLLSLSAESASNRFGKTCEQADRLTSVPVLLLRDARYLTLSALCLTLWLTTKRNCHWVTTHGAPDTLSYLKKKKKTRLTEIRWKKLHFLNADGTPVMITILHLSIKYPKQSSSTFYQSCKNRQLNEKQALYLSALRNVTIFSNIKKVQILCVYVQVVSQSLIFSF